MLKASTAAIYSSPDVQRIDAREKKMATVDLTVSDYSTLASLGFSRASKFSRNTGVCSTRVHLRNALLRTTSRIRVAFRFRRRPTIAMGPAISRVCGLTIRTAQVAGGLLRSPRTKRLSGERVSATAGHGYHVVTRRCRRRR